MLMFEFLLRVYFIFLGGILNFHPSLGREYNLIFWVFLEQNVSLNHLELSFLFSLKERKLQTSKPATVSYLESDRCSLNRTQFMHPPPRGCTQKMWISLSLLPFQLSDQAFNFSISLKLDFRSFDKCKIYIVYILHFRWLLHTCCSLWKMLVE